MPIITFWSQNEKENGQTATIAAVATQMAIDHNYKILLLSTQYNESEIENCFWDMGKEKKRMLPIFSNAPKVSLETGIEGLIKALSSNKMSPQLTTNYTKIVFRGRLEVLESFKGVDTDYLKVQSLYPELIKTSASYYDMILVDLNKGLTTFTKSILDISDVIVYGIDQRLQLMNTYRESQNTGFLMDKQNQVVFCGKYDKESKYTMKNIARYLKIKRDIHEIAYNTLFFEACNEGKLADYFLKIRSVKEEDKNSQLIEQVKELSDSIIYKVQEIQMKM